MSARRLRRGLGANALSIAIRIALQFATLPLLFALPAAPDTPAAPAGRNVLGIQTQPLDADSRKRLGLESGDGVLVSRVESAAAREAGLSPGMVILQVGRNKVNSPAALDRELAAAKPGDTVMLLVRSRGVTRFVAVTVEKD